MIIGSDSRRVLGKPAESYFDGHCLSSIKVIGDASVLRLLPQGLPAPLGIDPTPFGRRKAVLATDIA